MSTDVKLSNSQLAKINQSGGFLGKTFGNMLSNLGKKTLFEFGVPLSKLITKATLCLYQINLKEKKWETSCKSRKTIYFMEDINVFIKIIESLETVTKTVKNEIKNKKVDFIVL